MACGANFAWANRQMITHYVRQAWNKIMKNEKTETTEGDLTVLYDVAHNIAKLENGLIVHRKGRLGLSLRSIRKFPKNTALSASPF